MLDTIIRVALENRLIVVALSVVMLVAGVFVTSRMPVDVFPDLTAPTVTIMTESAGMAPEELETLVTTPVETAANGATGVRRVRSSTVTGLSTVWVEFTWGTDIYRARQVVNEKMQGLASVLPTGVTPTITPISSIMGEVMYIGLTGEQYSLRELKETADFVVRRRLLAVPGVSQVVVLGGEKRQYHVEVDPVRMMAYGVSTTEILTALRRNNENFAAGIMKHGGQDYLIRGVGRFQQSDDLGRVVVTTRNGIPVLVRDVANVVVGADFRVGDASVNTHPGIMISVGKHPATNTMELTQRLDEALIHIGKSLPTGMKLHGDLFRQADFIQRAIDNISRVLLEGAALVVIIIFLFLGSVRSTLISIIAMPLSLMCAIFTLRIFDITINTMTLGGMAIAIGVIVDDAIIDVENVYRRLRDNSHKPEGQRLPPLMVVFSATKEIYASVVNATIIIVLVFLPLFFLSGVEGRLLKPLGISYMVSIGASLVVALTVTPVLCSYLLPRCPRLAGHGEGKLFIWLQRIYRPVFDVALRRPRCVISSAVVVFAVSMIPLAMSGRSFLPPFNEGSVTITVATQPGTALEQSIHIADRIERLVKAHPNVLHTFRWTGRGDLDEHGRPPNASEVEAQLDLKGRTLDVVMDELRTITSGIPGTVIAFGQPIGHRIDHMMSGTAANIAIKVFGPELYQLRGLAHDVKARISTVPGLTDLSVEQQVEVPQLRVVPDREALARYGVTVQDIAAALETATAGTVVTKTLERDRSFDVVVRLPLAVRESKEAVSAIMLDGPGGAKIPLAAVARLHTGKGPNSISRENVQRKIVVQANVSGRDLKSVVADARTRIEQHIRLPEGYYIEYGGQFESESEATRMIGLLSVLSLVVIGLVLYLEFRSFRDVGIVMVNLPLAFIGGIVAVALSGGVINVSSLVGFITLFGIATRNGILLVSHYRHLMAEEGLALVDAVTRGSRERLRPVIMTALAAGLALVPFAFSAHKPGNEILSPLAIVILGGLVSSTILNMVVLPSLYVTFGRAIQDNNYRDTTGGAS